MATTAPRTIFGQGPGMGAALMPSVAADPAMAASRTAADSPCALIQGQGLHDSACLAGTGNPTATDEVFALTGWTLAHVDRVAATPGADVPLFDAAPQRGNADRSVVSPGAFSDLGPVLARPGGFGAVVQDKSRPLNGT